MEQQTREGYSEDIRARCGFHCSRCPAYTGNIRSEADRQRVHDTWKKIYGLEVPVEAIRCDGCLKPDEENPFRIGGDCPIRRCVQERSLPHCGGCKEFACVFMEKHLGSVESADKSGIHLSPEEHRDFIEPYLCRKFLETAGKR